MSASQSRVWIVAAVVVLIGGLLVAWLNRGYGEVSSTGYQYAMALNSACNRQDVKHLQQIVSKMEEAVKLDELPPRDARALLRIANRALDGQWQWASREVRRLMIDQIRPAPQAARTRGATFSSCANRSENWIMTQQVSARSASQWVVCHARG